MRDWSKIRYFRREEFIKDPDKVEWDVVLLMDEMRAAAGVPIHIHVAWDDGGHIADSSHYTHAREFSTAVDFNFQGWPLLQQWLFAERFPWLGIGIYPYWDHPGLHVDLQRIGRDHIHLGRRWWQDANGSYRAIDEVLLLDILIRRQVNASDA